MLSTMCRKIYYTYIESNIWALRERWSEFIVSQLLELSRTSWWESIPVSLALLCYSCCYSCHLQLSYLLLSTTGIGSRCPRTFPEINSSSLITLRRSGQVPEFHAGILNGAMSGRIWQINYCCKWRVWSSPAHSSGTAARSALAKDRGKAYVTRVEYLSRVLVENWQY